MTRKEAMDYIQDFSMRHMGVKSSMVVDEQNRQVAIDALPDDELVRLAYKIYHVNEEKYVSQQVKH